MADEGSTEVETRFSIEKRDDGERLAFGWASTVTDDAGALITDHQGTQIEPAVLERAAYDYIEKSRDADVLHERAGVGHIVESVVLTAEKRKAMGLPPGKTGWWVGFRVTDDEVWKRVKSGELAEFSIRGKAVKELVG